jgi:hypothetical protein
MIGLLITAAESAPVTEIGKRAFLTLIMFVFIGLSFWGMRIGWKNRSRQDIELPSTDIPAGAIKFTEPLLARFAGTTTSGSWLDRITNFDLGTPRGVDLQVFNTGIYLSDQSQFSLWIAKEQITNIATKQGIAWKLGDLLVDSGLRVNRHADHELIVSALKTFPRSTDLKNDGPQDKAETEA